MGADTFTAEGICPERAAEQTEADVKLPEVDSELLAAEDSTLSLADAVDLVNKCTQLETHDEELRKFKEIGSKTPILASEIGTDPDYKFTYVWFNLIGFIVLHIIGFSGAIAALLGYCRIWTPIYCKLMTLSI